MTTQGPDYAGAVGTNNWTNPSNAVGSDETSCATSVGVSVSNGNWNTFGFSIPAGATINGIVVELKQSDSSTSVRTWTVTLRKSDGGADTDAGITFDENQNIACGSTQNIRTYGTSTSLWGTTWSPADINSSGFTVRVSFPATAVTARLNWIRVTVYYTPSGVILIKSKSISVHSRKLSFNQNISKGSRRIG